MLTQSRLDCKKRLIEEYGLDKNTTDFICMWDLHYKHEKGQEFEKELKDEIKMAFPDKDEEKLKEIYDIIIYYFEDAKKRRRFFMRGNPAGFGYEVIDRNSGNFKLMLHTYDKEKGEAYLKELKKDDGAKAPDTSDEIPPHNLFHVSDHHGTHYFYVSTEREFITKAVEFIINQVKHGMYHKPEYKDDAEYLGMSKEEIENLPEGRVKRLALDEVKQRESNAAYVREHKNAWEIVNEIIDNEDNPEALSFSKITDVLCFYHDGRRDGGWDIVELR